MHWLWIIVGIVVLGFLAYEIWGTNTTVGNWIAGWSLSNQGI